MSNSTLGDLAIQEIRSAMQGLCGAPAKFQATRLAETFGCSVQHIYQLTKATRPRRKTRSDKGKRSADLLEHPGLAFAASQVITLNLDPELALMMARDNGYEIPVSLGTFRRYLSEHGITAADNSRDVAPYRNWSADAFR